MFDFPTGLLVETKIFILYRYHQISSGPTQHNKRGISKTANKAQFYMSLHSYYCWSYVYTSTQNNFYFVIITHCDERQHWN